MAQNDTAGTRSKDTLVGQKTQTENLTKGAILRHRTYAWLVHIFTMTGVAWAGLAILALIHGDLKAMWTWLLIALIVDGIDGTLARKANVKRWAPNFSGDSLDLIVDYLTWTFIPACFMYLYIDMGSQWLEMLIFVLICTSSMFCYCNVAMKSHDNYFMGFPAAWNIVALILWIVGSGPVMNVLTCIILAVLTLAPITFVHPFRVVDKLMPVNIVATILWVTTTGLLVVWHPETPVWTLVLWWGSGAWLMFVSMWRSLEEIIRWRKSV